MMPRRAISEVAEELGGIHISTARDRVLKHERGLKGAYHDEVELRTGKEKWKFVKDFNQLVSGESNVVAAMGSVQKSFVDSWTEQDYEDMEVTKEEVLTELEYEEVLQPLAKQYDDIEKRKDKSREKITDEWKTGWEEKIGKLMPLWQSEHFLQHLSALAIEFSDLEKVLPTFEVAINSRTARFKTKKGAMLTPQDVKFTITEMRKEPDTEEESNEDEEEESNDQDEEEEDEMEDGEVEKGVVELPRRPPTPEEPPRKRARSAATPPSTLPTPRLTLPPPQTSRAGELRSRLKERWDVTDKDLDAVEVAFNSLTCEEGMSLSSNQIVNRFKVFGEYIEAMAGER